MLTCPHCNQKVELRELPHPGLFASYKSCPHCAGNFTPDIHAKYRQVIFLFAGIISLVLTVLLYIDSRVWLVSVIISYIAMGVIVYWGNKHMFLVPYEKSTKEG